MLEVDTREGTGVVHTPALRGTRPETLGVLLGTAEVHGETVFALKFTEARNTDRLDNVFLAGYDAETFFFEQELEEIEKARMDTLGAEAT